MLFVFCYALRYALGRETFASLTITDFLIENLKLFNEKWLVNLLRDITNYETDRANGLINDAKFDFQKWMELKNALTAEFNSRNFPRDLAYYRLDNDVSTK